MNIFVLRVANGDQGKRVFLVQRYVSLMTKQFMETIFVSRFFKACYALEK